MIRTLIGDERLSSLTARLAPDRPTGFDYCPLLKPTERFPISGLAYSPRLEPRPMDDAAFFQAILEGVTRIERLAYGRLAELGTLQLASVRSVGGVRATRSGQACGRKCSARRFCQPARSRHRSARPRWSATP